MQDDKKKPRKPQKNKTNKQNPKSSPIVLQEAWASVSRVLGNYRFPNLGESS